MLPRDLADELCSLIEDEVRPVLCCRINVSKEGVIGDEVHFFAAKIKSHARLVYDHVSDWLENGHCDHWQPSDTIANVVSTLSQFATARLNWRQQHAVVFQDKPDYRFELSEDNDVIAIHKEARRTANRLVEEAMITANICAGHLLKNQFGTGVFNVHSGFKTEKIKDVLPLVNTEQVPLFSEEQLASLSGFSQLRRWLNEQDSLYLDTRLRKFQAFSEISHIPAPHYAMGLEIYATWTSPIRKYGDMINHRLIKAYLLNKPATQTPDDKIGQELATHRKHHKVAERSVSDWLYARTLATEPSNQTRFMAEIFDINRAGIRVRLIENGATAFIPASLIVPNKERIECNSELGTVSVDKDHVYKLSDVLEIVLVDVNIETRSIVGKPTQQFLVVADVEPENKSQ